MALKPIGGAPESSEAAAGDLSPAPPDEASAGAARESPAAPGADTLRGEQRLVGELQSRRLRSRLATRAAETRPRNVEPAVEFRVEVPADGDARAMRDRILKGPPFHFTDADILALERSGPGEEFYIHAGADRDRWATPAEVKGFPARGGETTIPVRESLVRDLVAFRARRLAEQAAAGVRYPALRRKVAEQLFAVLTGRGSERLRAGIDLAALADAQPAGVDAVTNAIRAAADDPAGRENAALQLALARASLSDVLARRAAFFGPFNGDADFAESRARALEAARLAGGLDPATGLGRPGAAVDRQEAALLNTFAAQVLAQAGDDDNAALREMIGRFYESDEAERRAASLTTHATVSRWKPASDGTHAPRAVTREERRLREFDDYNAATGLTTRARDPASGEADDARRRLMNEGAPRQGVAPTEDGGEVYTGATPADSEREEGGEVLQRRVYAEQQAPPRGVGRGAGAGGAADLVNMGLDYYTLCRETQELARQQAERAPHQAAADGVTRYPVPPRPEEVGRIADALREARGSEADAQRGARLEEALRFIPTMTEASCAFWNG